MSSCDYAAALFIIRRKGDSSALCFITGSLRLFSNQIVSCKMELIKVYCFAHKDCLRKTDRFWT